MSAWAEVDLDEVAGWAGNVHLAGLCDDYYANLRARFPAKSDMAQALFLGAVDLVKIMMPATAAHAHPGQPRRTKPAELGADAVQRRMENLPFNLAMVSVEMVDHVDPEGRDRPNRLDAVRVLWPDEVAADEAE